MKKNKIDKIQDEVLLLIENADNDTYAQILDWIFGNSLIEMVIERLQDADEQELKNFIKEFSFHSKKKQDKDVVGFFKVVCEGIRDEYENGASHRDLKTDIKTFKELLK